MSIQQIAGIMRTMRKLSDSKTVRVFVTMPEDMRDNFERSCDGKPMAGVIREMIATRIGKRPARTRQTETAK